MATKSANGVNGLSPPKPPFRRQGSSVQGTHPLAVAVVHGSPVDYSVTKGGARTWIVLLVFGLLCTSLYSLVSTNGRERGIIGEVDDDDEVDTRRQRIVEIEDEENEEEERNQQRRIVEQKKEGQKGKKKEEEKEENNVVEEDEDDEEYGVTVEESMLAGLRRKVEQRIRAFSGQNEMKRAHTHKNKEEEQERNSKSRKSARIEEVEDEEEEEKEKEKEEEEEEQPKYIQKERRQKRRGKRQEKEEEEKEKEEEKGKEEEKEKKEEEIEEEEVHEEEVQKEEKEKEDEKEEGNEEEEEEETIKMSHTQKRIKKRSHITSEPSIRPCKRKNCPPAYDAVPRKNLLLKKKKQSEYDDEDNEDYEDEEEEGDSEGEKDDDHEEAETIKVPPPPVINEIVALRKHRESGHDAYHRHAITNRDDHRIRTELDHIDRLLDQHKVSEALKEVNTLLKSHPYSPRALFSKARAFDWLAEKEDDENAVDLAIQHYQAVVDEDSTPDVLFRQAATRLADRARFRSHLHVTLSAQRSLIDRFPYETRLQSDMALTFLVMGRLEDAKKVLTNVLDSHPGDGYALTYRGLVNKLAGDIEEGVHEMKKGLKTLSSIGEELTDARVFYHLGEGLMLLGRRAEAYAVYEQGAELGLFLSAYQRSSYNMDGLRARPWWSVEQTGYGKYLKGIERQWVSMRHEALSILDSDLRAFEPLPIPSTLQKAREADEDNLAEFVLFEDSSRREKNCELAPISCQILDEFVRSSNSSKSSMSFVVLRAGTRIPPLCGPSNTRLVAELGLIVPSEARIRVGKETRGWKTGHFIVYDDSFEHELWIEGASSSAFRLVLSIDLWHPDVPSHLRNGDDDEDE